MNGYYRRMDWRRWVGRAPVPVAWVVRISAVVFLLATGVGARPAAAETYSIIDLGTLGGFVSSAYGINATGQVVGESDSDAGRHAFLYDGLGMHDLGTPGGASSIAYGINAASHAVGEGWTAGNSTRQAFLSDETGMHPLDVLAPTRFLIAHGINDSGQIVGTLYDPPASYSHAFLYSAGVTRDLGTLGGGSSEAWGISAMGQVVGRSDEIVGGPHAFLSSRP